MEDILRERACDVYPCAPWKRGKLCRSGAPRAVFRDRSHLSIPIRDAETAARKHVSRVPRGEGDGGIAASFLAFLASPSYAETDRRPPPWNCTRAEKFCRSGSVHGLSRKIRMKRETPLHEARDLERARARRFSFLSLRPP